MVDSLYNMGSHVDSDIPSGESCPLRKQLYTVKHNGPALLSWRCSCYLIIDHSGWKSPRDVPHEPSRLTSGKVGFRESDWRRALVSVDRHREKRKKSKANSPSHCHGFPTSRMPLVWNDMHNWWPESRDPRLWCGYWGVGLTLRLGFLFFACDPMQGFRFSDSHSIALLPISHQSQLLKSCQDNF